MFLDQAHLSNEHTHFSSIHYAIFNVWVVAYWKEFYFFLWNQGQPTDLSMCLFFYFTVPSLHGSIIEIFGLKNGNKYIVFISKEF